MAGSYMVDESAASSTPQPVFFYDLASPFCYLVAEQINTALPAVAEWEPVHAGGADIATPQIERELIEKRGAAFAQPFRWPPRWPIDSEVAMLAATYAKGAGRVVAFSLAAFRQIFAAGRDPAEVETVLIASAACEMHPAAVLKAVSLESVGRSLRAAGERAAAAGVRELPAIQLDGEVYQGEEVLEDAARALGGPG